MTAVLAPEELPPPPPPPEAAVGEEVGDTIAGAETSATVSAVLEKINVHHQS